MPPIPTADLPAQPFASFTADFATVWQAVERAAAVPQRKIVLSDPQRGVLTFSEYIAPELTLRSFRNQATLCAKLRQPPAGLAKLLAAQLSEKTRKELTAYDPRQFPSDDLIEEIAFDLNRLMFTRTITGDPEAGSPADSDALAVRNRRALEAVFPDEILHSSLLDRPTSAATVVISSYLLQGEAGATVLFVSAWIEGKPVRGAMARGFLAEVAKRLAPPLKVPS
jgi:hypothetical protein